jgi:hypothetical protein
MTPRFSGSNYNIHRRYGEDIMITNSSTDPERPGPLPPLEANDHNKKLRNMKHNKTQK